MERLNMGICTHGVFEISQVRTAMCDYDFACWGGMRIKSLLKGYMAIKLQVRSHCSHPRMVISNLFMWVRTWLWTYPLNASLCVVPLSFTAAAVAVVAGVLKFR